MDAGLEGLWPMYAWAAAVAIAIGAGLWSATNQRELRPALPLEHVAGAAVLGVFGWEMLIRLPGDIVDYLQPSAGLSQTPGLQAEQAFLLSQAAFGIGAGFD